MRHSTSNVKVERHVQGWVYPYPHRCLSQSCRPVANLSHCHCCCLVCMPRLVATPEKLGLEEASCFEFLNYDMQVCNCLLKMLISPTCIQRNIYGLYTLIQSTEHKWKKCTRSACGLVHNPPHGLLVFFCLNYQSKPLLIYANKAFMHIRACVGHLCIPEHT